MPGATTPSGRKSLLRFLAIAAAILGGAWWWQRPPPEPVLSDFRLSDGIRNSATLDADGIRAYGPAGITWLTYAVEHGRHPFIKRGSLPFDRAPGWLRSWIPEKWGGLREPPSSLEDERISASNALAKLGPDAAPAIPALARSIQNEDEQFAGSTASTLNAIGPASWPMVQGLLNNGSPQVREYLLATIWVRVDPHAQNVSDAELARVSNALVNGLGDPAPIVRAATAISIAHCRRDWMDDTRWDSAIPPLIHLLHDSDNSVRYWALSTLFNFGTKVASAVPRLIELLEDKDAKIRYMAANVLSAADRAGKFSVARLRQMSRDDPDKDCRTVATLALGEISLGPDEDNKGRDDLPSR